MAPRVCSAAAGQGAWVSRSRRGQRDRRSAVTEQARRAHRERAAQLLDDARGRRRRSAAARGKRAVTSASSRGVSGGDLLLLAAVECWWRSPPSSAGAPEAVEGGGTAGGSRCRKPMLPLPPISVPEPHSLLAEGGGRSRRRRPPAPAAAPPFMRTRCSRIASTLTKSATLRSSCSASSNSLRASSQIEVVAGVVEIASAGARTSPRRAASGRRRGRARGRRRGCRQKSPKPAAGGKSPSSPGSQAALVEESGADGGGAVSALRPRTAAAQAARARSTMAPSGPRCRSSRPRQPQVADNGHQLSLVLDERHPPPRWWRAHFGRDFMS